MSKVSKEDLKKLQELAGIYTDTLNEKDAGDSSNPKLAVGHVDNERDMIRRQLYQMGTYTVELAKMLKELPDSDFPNWWQAKIIKANDYLNAAFDYLDGEQQTAKIDAMQEKKIEVDDDTEFKVKLSHLIDKHITK